MFILHLYSCVVVARRKRATDPTAVAQVNYQTVANLNPSNAARQTSSGLVVLVEEANEALTSSGIAINGSITTVNVVGDVVTATGK